MKRTRTTVALLVTLAAVACAPASVDFPDTPTYWEKDDHDSSYNDSDNTGDAEPSVELGIAMFLEQVPVVDPDAANPVTYRTTESTRIFRSG